MSGTSFGLDAYLDRICLSGTLDPTRGTLDTVVEAHCSAIPYENIDVVLGKPPKLDLDTLQTKMVRSSRGGYCWEQNLLLREGLRALGFTVTGMIARVIRGFPIDAPRFSLHMVLRIDLPEGSFLVDGGFGNLTPTAPVAMVAYVEQKTPHETMRLLPVGRELALQSKLGDTWQNLWRVGSDAAFDGDYEVGNWFTATHPISPFVSNMIAARPGTNGVRHTFLNGRVNRRARDGTVERTELTDAAQVADVLATTFGLAPPTDDVRSAMSVIAGLDRLGAEHPAFS